MTRKTWKVYISENTMNTKVSELKKDIVLFEGSETKARKFYKDHKREYGDKLHLGYSLNYLDN